MIGRPLNFQELVQIGVNNIIIAKANGRDIGIHGERLIDQFAKTTYVTMRLQELVIKEELENYEKTGQYSDEDTLEDPETTGDEDNRPKP